MKMPVISFALLNIFVVLHGVRGLPSYCYNYYSEFSLTNDYNPNIYPEINTTVQEVTGLYNIIEVIQGI